MASLIRTLRRASSSSLIRNAFSLTSRFETRTYATEPELATKLPFDSNILRILRNEIQYQFEYAPPHQVQDKFYKYLDEQGVNDELAVFLHEYMMNKDRIELLHWMDSLKSFMER